MKFEIPPGGFRTLKFHSLKNRLILHKKVVSVMEPTPEPHQISDQPPLPLPIDPITPRVIEPTLGPCERSNLGMAPLASLIHEEPKLRNRFKRQVVKRLRFIQESAPAQPLTSDNWIKQIRLVPALFMVGEKEEADKILEEAQERANTHQGVKEKVSTKIEIARAMTLVDEKKAEAISLEALEIYGKLEDPQIQPDIGDLLKTMAQVATPRCIEKVSEIVDSIENKQEKLLAIISAASELSGRFSQHAQRPVNTHVQQDERPTNLTAEPKSDKRIGSIIDLGKRWLATVEKIGSAIRPHAIGAIAYMLKQFGQGDDELDSALHYCKTDLPTAEEQLQFLKVMGDNAIASNDLSTVRKLLETHKQIQAEAGVTGTTIPVLKLESCLRQTKKPSDIFGQLEKSRFAEYPMLPSEFSEIFSHQGEFERTLQALDQIPSAELRVKATIKSSSLLLKDGKKDRAIQLFEQALDDIEHIQSSNSLFWPMAMIAIASPRYSEMPLASKEMCVPYPLESLISKPELTHTTEIYEAEVRERDLNLHKEERAYHRERVAGYLSKLEVGKPQQFRNMEIFPLVTSSDYPTTETSTEYLTLKEALQKESLRVTEVQSELLESSLEDRECRINSQREIAEAIPKLKVTNTGEKPVFLREGEEFLIGRGQNWVSNTTTLLKGNWKETVIPCRIEMPYDATQSLDKLARFTTKQDALRKEGREISTQARVHSYTGTPTGIYPSQADELDEYVKAFECVPSQKGLLAMINGEVAGVDIIPCESTYKTQHPQLVRSYASNALLHEHGMGKREVRVSSNKARAFIEEIPACKETRYESVGYGWNHRFEGETVIGSALTSDEEEVVYMNFARRSLVAGF